MKELSKALSIFQARVKQPTKNRTVAFQGRKFSYADLSSVMQSINPVLSECNLAISQQIKNDCLVTVLMHTSGEYIDSCYSLPTTDKPQVFGSALTYGRRYSICAILNLAGDDDDDGQLAQDEAIKNPNKPADKPAADKPADDNVYRIPIGTLKGKTFTEVDRQDLIIFVEKLKLHLESKETIPPECDKFLRLANEHLEKTKGNFENFKG